MYVTVPVREDTKKLLDEFKEVLGAKSYDETVQALAKGKNFMLLKGLRGMLKGTPKFVRDKRD